MFGLNNLTKKECFQKSNFHAAGGIFKTGSQDFYFSKHVLFVVLFHSSVVISYCCKLCVRMGQLLIWIWVIWCKNAEYEWKCEIYPNNGMNLHLDDNSWRKWSPRNLTRNCDLWPFLLTFNNWLCSMCYYEWSTKWSALCGFVLISAEWCNIEWPWWVTLKWPLSYHYRITNTSALPMGFPPDSHLHKLT